MNIQQIRELDALGVSPSELLEYSLIKNDVFAISYALREHSIDSPDAEEPDPEEALTFAIDNLTSDILTTLLKPYGYQPISKRKQGKRENALSH